MGNDIIMTHWKDVMPVMTGGKERAAGSGEH